MAGTYQRADVFFNLEEQDRGGGIYEDVMSLFKAEHPVRFTRRKHRKEREKQGNDDEDIWDVYFEPEDLEDLEDDESVFLRRVDTDRWYEALNFRAQRDELGVLHHWTAKVKQIPPPTVDIVYPSEPPISSDPISSEPPTS